jgi:molybdopterin synthase sulfur carrier subunit
MKLRVQYTAQLRTVAGRPEDEVELPEGTTLAQLLQHLAARLDGAAAHLVANDGRVHRSLLIVVNDRAVSSQDVGGTLLEPGDVVTLLPPIAGG